MGGCLGPTGQFQPARLLPTGWPPQAAMNVGALREVLAKGEVPQGCVTCALSHQVPELRSLARVHNVQKAFAVLCLAQPQQSKAPHEGGIQRMLLPWIRAVRPLGGPAPHITQPSTTTTATSTYYQYYQYNNNNNYYY